MNKKEQSSTSPIVSSRLKNIYINFLFRKPAWQSHLTGLITISLCLLLSLPLAAQEDQIFPGMVDIQEREPGKGISGLRYDHRFRLILGFGKGEIKPGVLSEGGPTWQLNSFIGNAIDSNTSPVIKLSDTQSLPEWALRAEMDYTWKDRITVGMTYYSINQEYTRDEPARNDFFHPAGATKRWSYFEGIRLVKFNEDRKNVYAKYLHPLFFRGFKLGAFASHEWYKETNEVSFGSYVATNNNSTIAPGTINWSQGGIIPVVYNMKGMTVGPALRYQLFDWLGFHYRLTLVNRSGPMTMSGIRTIQQTNDSTGAGDAGGLIPIGFGDVKDSGLRHNFEAVARFMCRYTLHLGVLKEDFDRSYSFYYSKTFATNNNLPFQEKTPFGIGLAEMSSKHKIEKLEVYLKFGTAVFW